MASTQHFVDQVPAHAWHASTPCGEWDVQTVTNHITSENLWAGELFRGKTIAEVGDAFNGDLTGTDPAAAFRRSVASAKGAVEAPGSMSRSVNLSSGDTPGEDYAEQMFMDQLIHGWDIARGSGQSDELEADLVSACMPIAQRLTAGWRAGGSLGPEIPVANDADPQTRLLALFGRRR
jgi:uncharacterized protein (TIGR03086 family)